MPDITSLTLAQATTRLLEGFGNTVLLFALTLVLAIPLGLVVCACSTSRFRPLSYLFKAIIWVVRGTPLLLQIIVVFYGPGLLFGWQYNERMSALVIAFTINYSCYFSEIYRSGIQNLPRGQYEAGYVLGMTRIQIFFRIIMPQMIKRILPPMSNEIITLVKDTSLAQTISVIELVAAAKSLQNTYVVIWPLFYAGAFYLVFNGILTLLFGYLERKLNYYKV